MPSSVASSSNWDFTPVINLLRSPTYGSGDLSIPSRHTEPQTVSSSPGETAKNVTNELGAQAHNANTLSNTSPRLGDFGSLWDLLGQGTTTLGGAKAPKVEPSHQEPDATPTQQSFKPSTTVKILKRPSTKVTDTETPSRTPPRPIPVSGKSKSRSLQDKAKAGLGAVDQPNHKSYDTSSSESNAEVESDENLSNVFDPPYSRKRGVLPLVPSQVAASDKHEPYDTPPSSFDELEDCFSPETVKNLPSNGPIRVQPIAYKSANDRRVGLLTKLLKSFPDYAEAVSQAGRPVNGKTKKPSARPVHVFVDMSNIMVGFHDSVKVSRNIPIKTRIRRLPLSFQNFSLILERGRPTAKRVLVGSDRFAAINEGEQLGYETNILDRVQKVKQLTRRQLKFRKSAKGESHELSVSSSEMNDMPAERWVEQGVDEILHLKILESLLDTDEPATIVLATGDAAEAEYSGGFMKMVERALQRGWNVELVSFTQVTSYAYRKKEFRTKWGNRFKMIALDEYIEELLDM
ncbi:hypothetical protein ASPWEDRAFT_33695 [Aspergillus wentii DTO 134E9]|uniref:NYN domain-containing protein n=1 Tax=Aspergillus wentii DTO 134E9 TaxID=1073089 RepID=A0A1L9RZI0_ASPWE|nr:uncharacterized protein ASPWEDRAFT_33695 [Aspergillus wentii DTO 134E9]KAI9932761.1 hypothetical protein MW887_009011 [Aspergillus wentii]OJJ40339.1 hypothetical protein ASPWEDRAFT_33695 [Aspergillus wentii DTO 134E9]